MLSFFASYTQSPRPLKGPEPADVGYTGTGSTTSATPILGGSGLSNVTITGTGVIDGNGQPFWDIFNQGGSFTNQDRPRIIKVTGTNLKIGANFNDTGQNTERVTPALTGCEPLTGGRRR